jgi:hypothetical protein
MAAFIEKGNACISRRLGCLSRYCRTDQPEQSSPTQRFSIINVHHGRYGCYIA